eukprot:c13201_g1_i1 orf=593-889(+)
MMRELSLLELHPPWTEGSSLFFLLSLPFFTIPQYKLHIFVVALCESVLLETQDAYSNRTLCKYTWALPIFFRALSRTIGRNMCNIISSSNYLTLNKAM